MSDGREAAARAGGRTVTGGAVALEAAAVPGAALGEAAVPQYSGG